MFMKILIAEDEKNIAKGIETIIQTKTEQKNQFYFAENGMEALELAYSSHPDLIITDIRMFKMTGLDFIEQLRKSGVNTKIIVISGYSNFDYARRACRMGVMDYLLKPIDKQRLLELVEQVWQELPQTYAAALTTLPKDIVHDFFNLDLDNADYPDSLKRIINFIRRDYTQDLCLQALSEELLLHPNYISTLVNKHLHVSFNYILDYVRLEKVCEFLLFTDMTITYMAHLVGYNNERRLYHAFKKKLGYSPGTFRKLYSDFSQNSYG